MRESVPGLDPLDSGHFVWEGPGGRLGGLPEFWRLICHRYLTGMPISRRIPHRSDHFLGCEDFMRIGWPIDIHGSV